MKNGIDIKKLVLWSLYDFANSFVLITFFLYYSQWLVIDRGVSDFWFNMTFVVSSLLFLLTVPVIGSITDKIGLNMPGLKITTILSIIFFFFTGLIANFFSEYYILSIITFSFATYFYLFCFTFYNPLLKDVAIFEKHGLASGWGQFGNWIGQIIGLLVAIPFASGAIKLFGVEGGRAQTLIPATFFFVLFSIPVFMFFKENGIRNNIKINIKDEYKNIFKFFINLCKSPGVGIFFLAYFFFNDAITTASNNFPIYVEKVFGVNDDIKSYLLICILIASAISAPISGWIADKIGLKKTLLWVIGGWIIIFPLMAIKNFTLFIFVTIIMGLWFGSIWTVTRAYLLHITPPSMINQSFTYYTLMEKLATFIGPISWGIAISFLPRVNALNYRLAAIIMTIFIFIGLFFARKLPENT